MGDAAGTTAREQLVERQQDLHHDQDDDIPFDTQRVFCLQQVKLGFQGTRNQVEFALEGKIPLTDLEFSLKTVGLT